MSKKVLIVVDADPRQTHRAAEGLRLAAGLAAWMTTEITVCLLGPASVLLEADEEWLGEEDVRLAWPVLREVPVAVFAERVPTVMSAGTEQVRELVAGAFSRLAAEADYLIRF